MSNPCSILPGWGSLSFGAGPWSGTVYSSSTLPSYPPFDVFCLGPCGSLLTVTLYPEVTVGPGGQWNYDSGNDALHIWSGATAAQSDPAVFEVRTGLPDQFTVEWTIRFDELPLNFSTPGEYFHIGAGSHQGYIFGLLFSQEGLASAHCPDDPSAFSPIPASSGIISQGQTYVIKIVVSDAATYVYITEYADFVLHGHRLRFVLPSVQAATVCPSYAIDMAWVHLDGSNRTNHKVDVRISEFCLASTLLITDFPPIADAGPDQAAQFCSIVQLDGSASHDPEGAGLAYSWRLIDAPSGSGFVYDLLVGRTYPLPLPTGFTDKWYCDQLPDLPVGTIMPGDVLVVGGAPYTITALGDDLLHGHYIQVVAEVIPDDLPTGGGKILRQMGLSGPTTVKPTFYPDVPGFYKFDLTVFDGAIWSAPSTTVVNVLVSSQPRGVVPDAKFIWEYLSNFWKLVDDRHRYTVVWSGLAQFCASELLNLWQYEYSKSLRDIQRTFQRRWLDYPLRYTPAPAAATLRVLYEPYDSEDLDPTNTGVEGTSITVSLPSGVGVKIGFYIPAGESALSASALVEQIRAALPTTFTVSILPRPASRVAVRLAATHSFSVSTTSPGFPAAPARGLLYGDTGAVLWNGSAYYVGRSLTGLGLTENDFLEVDGALYRIVKLQSSSAVSSDDVVVLKDPIPATASHNWSIPSYFRYPGADFYGQLVGGGDDVVLDIRNRSGVGGYYRISALGAAAADPDALAVDISLLDQIIFGLAYYTITLRSVFRRTYIPISGLVVDIPTLQETLTDSPEKGVLRRNLDYFIESYRGSKCIRFDTRIWVHEDENGDLVPDAYPPVTLWAESTYLDNRPAIEANFGAAVGFTLENLNALDANVDYLSAVRGLWYNYFNGPRVALLRSGAQILLGLPFAEEEGVIEEIRTDFSPTTERILIRDAQSTQVVRSYTYPSTLSIDINPATGSPYAVGDTVRQFAPLVRGVELLDYVSDKEWIGVYASGGGANTLQRFFRFLLRVDYGAFNLAALLFVRDFILKVKPTYTSPIFSVLVNIKDVTIDVTDEVTFGVVLSIFDSPMEGHNVAFMWDQPEDGYASVSKTPPVGPMGSPWKSSYDCTQAGSGVDWGFDRLAPHDEVKCTMCLDSNGGFPPFDSVFAWDLPVYHPNDPNTPINWSYDTSLPAGIYCRDKAL